MFHININEIERELNFVTIALRDLADVRPYDLCILGVAVASVIVSTIVAVVAYRLNRRQIKIANRQSKISKEQTEISRVQTKVMEQQNSIALFEKRYEVYSCIEKIISQAFFIKSNKNPTILNSDSDKLNMLFITLRANTSTSSLMENSNYIVSNFEKLELLFLIDENDRDLIKNIKIMISALVIDWVCDEVGKHLTQEDIKLLRENINLDKNFSGDRKDKKILEGTFDEKLEELIEYLTVYRLDKKLKKQCYLAEHKLIK